MAIPSSDRNTSSDNPQEPDQRLPVDRIGLTEAEINAIVERVWKRLERDLRLERKRSQS